MVNLKSSLIFVTVIFISACSNSTPKLVSDLGALELPIVQPSSPPQNVNQQRMILTYKENEKTIHELTRLLEERYLAGTTKDDIFKNRSLPHHVYKSLSNLEQAGLINSQYYTEGNATGLKKLHDSLQPYAEIIK